MLRSAVPVSSNMITTSETVMRQKPDNMLMAPYTAKYVIASQEQLTGPPSLRLNYLPNKLTGTKQECLSYVAGTIMNEVLQ